MRNFREVFEKCIRDSSLNVCLVYTMGICQYMYMHVYVSIQTYSTENNVVWTGMVNCLCARESVILMVYGEISTLT